MILLGTNVVAEPLRAAPDARAVAWIDAQPLETLFLLAITVAELRAGVSRLPAGRRQAASQDNPEKRVLPRFAGRVLLFDLACTPAYAVLEAKARAAGGGGGCRRCFYCGQRLCEWLDRGSPGHAPLRGRSCWRDQPLVGLSVKCVALATPTPAYHRAKPPNPSLRARA